MLSSVTYIHNKGIIHRDLKLENFLFSDETADSELKMIDFGLSKVSVLYVSFVRYPNWKISNSILDGIMQHFAFGEVQHEAVGTPYTVAPEVIKGSYDERCDGKFSFSTKYLRFSCFVANRTFHSPACILWY